MRRWFPEGRWSVAARLLVSVATMSVLSAPLWLPLALIGDFGKWAKEAALEGLLGVLGLSGVLLAVGRVVEWARETKTAGWGPLGRGVLRGVLRGAAVVGGVMLVIGVFQEGARPFRWVDHWLWGWPADEGVMWDAVWVGGRLAEIGAMFGVLALGILVVTWAYQRFGKLAARKQDRVLDWLGVLALAGVGWLAWRNPFGVAAASIFLGVMLAIGFAGRRERAR